MNCHGELPLSSVLIVLYPTQPAQVILYRRLHAPDKGIRFAGED